MDGRISEKVTPFKIVGNIHYVGGTDMTVFLITTPEGHILIDQHLRAGRSLDPSECGRVGFQHERHRNYAELPRSRGPH